MSQTENERIPQVMQSVFDATMGMIEPVCRQHLNEEYAQMCRRLAGTLARKRPSPLAGGRVEIWACAIVHAVGSVNFLFDRSQTPHLRADQLCQLFGVSQRTAAAKAGLIQKMLNMGPFDPHWCLPSKLAQNPLAWMIQVDGMIVDARHAPRHIQEEACRLGLIPFVPLQPEERN